MNLKLGDASTPLPECRKHKARNDFLMKAPLTYSTSLWELTHTRAHG